MATTYRASSAGLAGALILASAGLVAVTADRQGAKPSAMKFRPEQIASDFGVGYAVVTGDVNADKRTDILAINATDLVWFESPGWQKQVIVSGATVRDNVTLAPHDVDGDGRLDVALGAGWTGANTGTLQWVRQNAPGSTPAWEVFQIAAEPTLHRIRWADVDGDKRLELVVAPLHGKDNKGPAWEGVGARLLIFRPPANPRADPWPIEVADETNHIMHNFLGVSLDTDAQDELVTASREGLFAIKRDKSGKWSRTQLGEGAPGEVKLGRVGGRRMFATVEPWHGASVVIYVERQGVWSRTVIESALTGGHALGWADFDGDGSDELAVGWRDQKPGLAVYAVTADGALGSKLMIDEGGMATEDLVIADLNGDKQPDIVASGRATRNVKIYWNETRAPAAPKK
jgi:FG-GAP-like repeat